ncbi:hypothetical protein [Citrobacter sp. ESBL3]|uniref:hypothetical protein n=1 Tax=Citrobacter sp. ESBL3 TaxID=3077326 RepID=UPI002FC99CB1
MSKLTRKKFEAAVLPLAVAAAFSCALPAHAEVTGSTDTQFTTTVHVVSDNTCQLTVTPPAVTAFDATWTGNTASATSSIVVNNPAIDPIQVVATGGTNCSLNNTRISGTVTGTPTPAATNPTVAHGVIQQAGSSGGGWAYMPVVARIRLFTDSAFTSQTSATVTATGADGIVKEQKPTPVYTAGASVNYKSTLGLRGIMLDDSYYDGNVDGLPLLTNAGMGGSASYTTSSPQEVYKSAMFNISGIIGINPVNAATGVEDLSAVANGDTVVMPLTVTITEA